MSKLIHKGKVISIGKLEQVTDSFSVKNLVVSGGDEKYPQKIRFEFSQANADKLDPVNIGDEVEVSFNLRGREWNEKVYNTLAGWKVNIVSKAEPVASSNDSNNDPLPF